jgi:hypothetical protein
MPLCNSNKARRAIVKYQMQLNWPSTRREPTRHVHKHKGLRSAGAVFPYSASRGRSTIAEASGMLGR